MKSKSVLVNYIGFPSFIGSLLPDNGLASLAGQLISKGHETKILDYATVDVLKKLFPSQCKEELKKILSTIEKERNEEHKPSRESLQKIKKIDRQMEEHAESETKKIAYEILEYIKQNELDFIGFKLFVGQGFNGSIRIAQIIKEKYPQILIVGGGPQVDCFREEIFNRTDAFDIIAFGEAENTIEMIADYSIGKFPLKDIPNIIYKEDGKIIATPLERIKDLTVLQKPVYNPEIYPAMKGNQKIHIFLLEENRGCPYCCNFCIHPIKSGKVWRKREAIDIVNSMEESVNKYGLNMFRFIASSPSQRLRIEIAEEIIKRDLEVNYTGFDRISDKPVEYYKLLAKSGLKSIFFGVESGSQEILDHVMGKKTKVEQIRKTINNCREAGIYSIVGIIYPAPKETLQSAIQTKNLLLEIKPDSVLLASPFLIYGTQWYNERESYGFDITDSFIQDTMNYRVKFTFPPYLWDPYPYTINSLDSNEINNQTDDLAKTLTNNEITLGVLDEMTLMAEKLGMSLNEFGKICSRIFQTGDDKIMTEIVSKINRGKNDIKSTSII